MVSLMDVPSATPTVGSQVAHKLRLDTFIDSPYGGCTHVSTAATGLPANLDISLWMSPLSRPLTAVLSPSIMQHDIRSCLCPDEGWS